MPSDGDHPAAIRQFHNHNTDVGSGSLQPEFFVHDRETIEGSQVDVTPPDEYIGEHRIDVDRIGVIRIDVERFALCVSDEMRRLDSKSTCSVSERRRNDREMV